MTIRYPNIRLYKLERTTSDTEMEDQVEKIVGSNFQGRATSRLDSMGRHSKRLAGGHRLGGRYLPSIFGRYFGRYLPSI